MKKSITEQTRLIRDTDGDGLDDSQEVEMGTDLNNRY